MIPSETSIIKFQFHKVRLKVTDIPAFVLLSAMFQFHKVRLKGKKDQEDTIKKQVSIP